MAAASVLPQLKHREQDTTTARSLTTTRRGTSKSYSVTSISHLHATEQGSITLSTCTQKCLKASQFVTSQAQAPYSTCLADGESGSQRADGVCFCASYHVCVYIDGCI